MLYIKLGDKKRFSHCKIVHYQEVLTKATNRLLSEGLSVHILPPCFHILCIGMLNELVPSKFATIYYDKGGPQTKKEEITIFKKSAILHQFHR